MKEFEITLKLSESPSSIQIKKLKNYLQDMPIEKILSGLKFANNRWEAQDAVVLKVGRKSKVNKEIHSVSVEQAEWRLKNWNLMIANYRRRGYSYPTISRIKKHLIQLSKSKSRS